MAIESSRSVFRLSLLAAAMGSLAVGDACALGWNLDASVSGRTTVSNNGRQDSSDGSNSVLIGVTPTLTATSKGSSRVQATATYSLDANTRFGDDSGGGLNQGRDTVSHRFGGTFDAEVLDEFFYVEARADVSQQLGSLLSAPSADANDTLNNTTVGNYTITPRLVQRFGNFAIGQASYSTGGVFFDNNAGQNANLDAFNLSLSSGRSFSALSWSLAYSQSKSNSRNFADSTFERYSAQVGYAVSRTFRVFATVGEDINEVQQSAGFGGSSYSIGFGWSPSRRANIEISAGERYFGKTFSASGNYSTRATTWSLRYYEDVSDISRSFDRRYWECSPGSAFPTYQESVTQPAPDCVETTLITIILGFDNGTITRPQILGNFIGGGALSQGVYVIKGFNAGVGWTLGRLGLNLSLSDSRRLYQFSLTPEAQEDSTRQASLSASYRLNRSDNLGASVSFTQNEVPAELLSNPLARSDELVTYAANYSHIFSRDLTSNFSLRHTQRDSNDATANYDETSITASFTLQF